VVEALPTLPRTPIRRSTARARFIEPDLGPFSLTAEYDEAHVASPETGDPQFRGYYVTGAWVVTGEHRPYDRKVGYARRVMPAGNWGP